MKVTLSFDNGPTETTGEVLDTLAERGILASFFVVGAELEKPGRRALTERAAAEGHWVGNHTMTHSIQFGDCDDPTLPAREIGQAQALLGPLAHPDKLFRPYGGGGILDRRLLNPAAITYLRANDYTCVLWNNVPHDWDRPDDWVSQCLAEIHARPWSLVVLHDLPSGAMRHLPAFLDELDARGVDLVQEFPEATVPIYRGAQRESLADLSVS
ncbi:polysaccharide deacetylase family protein [Nocardia sp. NPDC051929]|uniref:polysaccharide deacetylase family protein n=1 Tax=Nocardia sp. NPDC051929 TaxID=3364327 RepID=UPI0037C78832